MNKDIRKIAKELIDTVSPYSHKLKDIINGLTRIMEENKWTIEKLDDWIEEKISDDELVKVFDKIYGIED